MNFGSRRALACPTTPHFLALGASAAVLPTPRQPRRHCPTISGRTASAEKCSTWNIAANPPRSSYPQPRTPSTIHLISTFRRPIRVLHSFSNENFLAAPLRHCRPPSPRSKLLESASPAQPWDASS